VDKMGRAIVLMPGPYDTCSKKVNGIIAYKVFGSHSWRGSSQGTALSVSCILRLLDWLVRGL
jgi:hypothetical protein